MAVACYGRPGSDRAPWGGGLASGPAAAGTSACLPAAAMVKMEAAVLGWVAWFVALWLDPTPLGQGRRPRW